MGGTSAGARNLVAVAAVGLLLAGCGGSSGTHDLSGHGKTRGYYKVGAPYQVKGVWYYPKVDYDYDESGTASWYGEAFHGKPTANGEIFDLNQVSAAHKTLQLPSVVEVTNLRNGRALQMRVNDRGPFVGDRIIDLSRRAAQLLGFEGAGTAPVRVRIVKEESIKVAEAAMRGDVGRTIVAQAPRSTPVQTRVAAAAPPSPRRSDVPPVAPRPPVPIDAAPIPPPPAAPAAAQPIAEPVLSPPARYADAPRRPWPSLIASAQAAPLAAPAREAASGWRPSPAAQRPSGRIFVQAGAFAVVENAQRVRARVARLGGAEVLRTTINGTPLYRVRLGPVASDAEARRLLGKVVESGYPEARVIDE